MTHSSTPSSSVALTRSLAVGSLVGLIVLGLAWEMWLAPLRPGGSILALKVLPLVVPLAGLLKNRMYTYRWVSLMVWLYFTEGVVRAWSDVLPLSRALARTGASASAARRWRWCAPATRSRWPTWSRPARRSARRWCPRAATPAWRSAPRPTAAARRCC
ncbi:MAG: DUF2069 domain-containing protein [Variovorax sp.]|nr:MAG: DUF2069 domain-containing protein [Variovorax sp.]